MSPHDGDLLVVQTPDPEFGYEIEIVPGRPQVRYGAKDEAVTQARLMAKRAAVDVWYRDGEAVTLVGRYRLEG